MIKREWEFQLFSTLDLVLASLELSRNLVKGAFYNLFTPVWGETFTASRELREISKDLRVSMELIIIVSLQTAKSITVNFEVTRQIKELLHVEISTKQARAQLLHIPSAPVNIAKWASSPQRLCGSVCVLIYSYCCLFLPQRLRRQKCYSVFYPPNSPSAMYTCVPISHISVVFPPV